MLGRGEISKATFDEWAHETDFSKLPERKKSAMSRVRTGKSKHAMPR